MGDVAQAPVVLDSDPFHTVPPATLQRISDAFTSLPPQKRGALLVMADLQGNATATVAAKLGKHWTVAAGAGVSLEQPRPAGYFGIEGSW